jgi:6-phosphogluconolactonase
MIQLTVAGDADAAARTTAERVAAVIAEARAERGTAHISLAGGRTPARAYRLLAQHVSDWSGVHLWFGDERCVPLDDPDSNYKMVIDDLLAGASQPPPTIHPVTEAALDPATAADAYAQELRDELGVGDGPPRLDLALLGLGEDGHTASLFPDDPVLEEQERLCVPVHGTKPPFDRITLTLPVLRAARRAIILAEGTGKAWAIGQLLAGPSPRIPASLLDHDGAEIELIVDRAAAPAA